MLIETKILTNTKMKHRNLQLSSFECDIFVINITGIGLLK